MSDPTVVSADGVPLATRDFGGSGPAVVLLHGLGRTLIDWSVVGPILANRYRTVAFDLRGHGQSGDGAWSWQAALADIATVAVQLELGVPAVVGHSLGGMLAVMWAEANPEARVVVNLDGHGRRALSQYVGIDASDARRRISDANERVKASLGALSGPLPPPVVDGLLAQQRKLAAHFGAPEDLFVESIRRTLRDEDGAAFLRPSPNGLGSQILADAESFDMFALYPQVRCPVLVVAGTEPDIGVDQQLLTAYRAGLRRDLERLAVDQTNVTVEFIPGGHGMLFEHPDRLAGRIISFLSH